MNIETKPNYLIFGSPGAGKGTLCTTLEVKGYQIIAMGNILRREVKTLTSLGKQVKHHLDSGILINDQLAFDIISKELTSTAKPFAIEGFPSTVAQYQLFFNFLKEHKLIENLILIQINCPEENAIQRILGRLICDQCSSIYNRNFKPPQQDSRCDLCKGILIQRAEDNAITAKKRIQNFNNKTFQVIQLAKNDFPVVIINALQIEDEWAL